jgi:phosphoglycerate dehydrogenase-like enzyme
MSAPRKRVGLSCNEDVRSRYIDPVDVARLETVADFEIRLFDMKHSDKVAVPRDAAAEAQLAQFAAPLDVLLVCHGTPYVSAEVLTAAPKLTLLGDLEGDRFSYHLDIAAAEERGLVVVDTSHGSSYPTAEWALGLALVCMRNAGYFFRRIIAHEPGWEVDYDFRRGPGYDRAELTGKRVGMIGFGHLARRLTEFLRPFNVDIVAYDPYAPRELAIPYGIVYGPLEAVLDADVVFMLLPETPGTVGLLGPAELDLLRPGTVFVNVGRGKTVDSAALIARLKRGDIVAGLDVFDPEPLPRDSEIADLQNVFYSPHLAGVTEESRRRFFSLMVDECLRHFDGLEPLVPLTPSTARLNPALNQR